MNRKKSHSVKGMMPDAGKIDCLKLHLRQQKAALDKCTCVEERELLEIHIDCVTADIRKLQADMSPAPVGGRLIKAEAEKHLA